MITGFNTDIEFQGVTYHVQTEDKGVETPLILSLVYDRGTILASKRSPYNDLLNGAFNEKELTERLNRQHKLICAAVRAGRIDDLKRMTQKESTAKRKIAADKNEKNKAAQVDSLLNQIPSKIETEKVEQPLCEKTIEDIPAPFLLNIIAAPGGNLSLAENSQTNIDHLAIPGIEGVLEIPISVLEDLIVEEIQVVEEEIILPAEAVSIVDETPAPATDEKLKIELLNEVSFKGGERKTLSVLVKGERSEVGLNGAHVMVKILGSSFRPLIFHAKTDSGGVAIVHLQLPSFSRGRAAILVRAMSGGEEVELRRSILQE
ncbi:MAG: hypothetical protein ACR2L1_07445 [Pyrinomonadaceae bacterium]